MAQEHPEPYNKENRRGAWAPKGYIYGYFEDSIFKNNPPDFKAFDNSKKNQFRIGIQGSIPGTLGVRRSMCACPSCALPLGDYNNCKVKSITGAISTVQCPKLREPERKTTRMQLESFALTMRANEFRAVRTADEDADIEGRYWIAEVLSDAFQVEDTVVVAGETMEKGWWVVKAYWLECGARRVSVPKKVMRQPIVESLRLYHRIE